MTYTSFWDTRQRVFDALDALYTYDKGDTDSGILDEDLHRSVKDYLKQLTSDERRLLLSRYVRETYLTEERLTDGGYGIEEVKNFLEWIDEEMDISFLRCTNGRGNL